MCQYCNSIPCHPRCPNYEVENSNCVCDLCEEPIIDGEQYIKFGKKFAHTDCFNSINEAFDWIEYDIKIMENSYYEDYY